MDPIGAIAGDMFIAELLDAFPEHEAGVLASIAAAGIEPSVSCRLIYHHDTVLSGHRFLVAKSGDESSRGEIHQAGGNFGSHHHHTRRVRRYFGAPRGVESVSHIALVVAGTTSEQNLIRELEDRALAVHRGLDTNDRHQLKTQRRTISY